MTMTAMVIWLALLNAICLWSIWRVNRLENYLKQAIVELEHAIAHIQAAAKGE